jgi:hypothetical protein
MIRFRTPRMRVCASAAVAALLLPGLVVLSSVASAATAPPPAVTAVTVRGTKTPSEVLISWKRPASAAYAGARVVVVPGRTPTKDRNDPAAVLVSDASSKRSSLTWSGTHSHVYSISVFAHEATGTAFALPATARAALPGPVHHLVIATSVGTSMAYSVNGAHADTSLLCEAEDRAPATLAEAKECSPLSRVPWISSSSDETPGHFSVFSVDSATGALGPPVSEGDGKLPALAPDQMYDYGVNPTTLDLAWWHRAPKDAGIGSGANVSWEILWAAGTDSPVGNPRAHRILMPVAGAHNYGNQDRDVYRRRFTGLVPEAPYSFAIRGVDSDGEVSDWAEDTTSARARGHYLVGSTPTGVTGRAIKLPEPFQFTYDHKFAVEPNGTAHVLVHEFGGRNETLPNYRIVAPTGLVRRGALPKTLRHGPLSGPSVTIAAAPSSPGVVAVSDGFCVYLRVAAAPWRKAGCMGEFTSAEDERLNGHQVGLVGFQIDRRNKVHVLWTESAGGGGRSTLRYATDASGRWVVRDVSPFSSWGFAALTYDLGSDEVVLLTGGPYAKNTRYKLRIASKRATAAAFGAFSTIRDTGAARAVIPTGVASYGGRITLTAARRNFRTGNPWGAPVFLSGDSPQSIGAMTPIPHVDAYADVMVSAHSATRVVIAWVNNGFSRDQGIWTASRVYSPSGALVSNPVRQTRSVYDRLEGFAVDAAGRTHVMFKRD